MAHIIPPAPGADAQYEFALDVCGFMGSDDQLRPRMTTAREVIAALDPAVPVQRAHILAVQGVCRHGGRYSGHSSGVCYAAWQAVGRAEPGQYEAGHVAALLRGEQVW